MTYTLNKNKYIIRKLRGKWVVRLPNYIGHWTFNFTSHDTCIVFVNGVEQYHRKHPEWRFAYHEVAKAASMVDDVHQYHKESNEF